MEQLQYISGKYMRNFLDNFVLQRCVWNFGVCYSNTRKQIQLSLSLPLQRELFLGVLSTHGKGNSSMGLRDGTNCKVQIGIQNQTCCVYSEGCSCLILISKLCMTLGLFWPYIRSARSSTAILQTLNRKGSTFLASRRFLSYFGSSLVPA